MKQEKIAEDNYGFHNENLINSIIPPLNKWHDTPERTKVIDLIKRLHEHWSKIDKYYYLIPLRNLICIYNLHTDFKEFEGIKEIYSNKSGYGGSGGQMRKYFFMNGQHCYESNIPGDIRTYCKEKFAFSFSTKEQWELMSNPNSYIRTL